MQRSFAIFMVFWIAMGIASAIFYKKASYETKKSLHPFLASAFAVIFLGFAEWAFRGRLPWPFIIAVALGALLSIRSVQFCPQCNATLNGRFRRFSFCPKCGASLQTGPR